jgi:hypothetical protein
VILFFGVETVFIAGSILPRGNTAQSTLLDISKLMPPIRGIPKDVFPQGIPDKGSVIPAKIDEDYLCVIPTALSWLGTPYLAGGYSKRGVDCSGFVFEVLEKSIPEMGPFPRTSREFDAVGLKIEVKSIQPGDILVFEDGGIIDHVGLALSRSTFIHSASEGTSTGVIISGLHEGHWGERLYDVRRPTK